VIDRPSNPTWSRRPHIGALAKAFQSTLPAPRALEGLRALLAGPDVEGEIDGNIAWLRPLAKPRPPTTTLRLTIREGEGGARVEARFDVSRLDEMDVLIYAGATAFGVVVSGSWLTGHLPAAAKAAISAAVPGYLAALALVALAHYAFRRWRKAVRDRLFDSAMIALGVPIE
jgi:hypothetical protein